MYYICFKDWWSPIVYFWSSVEMKNFGFGTFSTINCWTTVVKRRRNGCTFSFTEHSSVFLGAAQSLKCTLDKDEKKNAFSQIYCQIWVLTHFLTPLIFGEKVLFSFLVWVVFYFLYPHRGQYGESPLINSQVRNCSYLWTPYYLCCQKCLDFSS